jgi:hypothetical protein
LNKQYTLKLALAFAGTLAFSGCAYQLPVAYQPVPPPAYATGSAVAPVVVESEYVAAPSDVYIGSAVDTDVVFIGGSTYVWYVGHDGMRHRYLYGHGDHRAEVFHRREELRVVMAHHEGHLPMPGHDRVFPGHMVGHPPVMPHPVPQPVGQPRAPQAPMHPQSQPQVHSQMQPQMHPQPAPHVTENAAHHPNQKS